jgi:hypothetical protein
MLRGDSCDWIPLTPHIWTPPKRGGKRFSAGAAYHRVMGLKEEIESLEEYTDSENPFPD